MSSEIRSSSAVRSLRSIFENKEASASGNIDYTSSPSLHPRGRSPAAADSTANRPSRPTSRIRASFVPVDTASMSAEGVDLTPEEGVGAGTARDKRASTADLRRASVSASLPQDLSAVRELRKSIVAEQVERQLDVDVKEAIPEAAIEATPAATPAIDLSQAQAMAPAVEEEGVEDSAPSAGEQNGAPENPEKPVTGAEDETAAIKPADPSSVDAVSGAEALPPQQEDLRPANGSLSRGVAGGVYEALAVEPQKPSDAALAVDSGATKSPLSADVEQPSVAVDSSKQPCRNTSRSSLTAPTAASVARQAAAASEKARPAPTTSSTTQKPKRRSTTKPLEASSRLTAPTAASRARAEKQTPPDVAKPSLTSLPSRPATSKPNPSRPTPRNSLVGTSHRPSSRTSHNTASQATKKPAPALDNSFLERMTRPTAASAKRAQEKAETKSPPRPQKVSNGSRTSIGGAAALGAQKRANGVGKRLAAAKASKAAEHGYDDAAISAAAKAGREGAIGEPTTPPHDQVVGSKLEGKATRSAVEPTGEAPQELLGKSSAREEDPVGISQQDTTPRTEMNGAGKLETTPAGTVNGFR